jgi:3-oxoacyl-[acyl-carrier protein] reductase
LATAVEKRKQGGTVATRDIGNRVVLVTGGGTGIGRAAAARFAADGESVFITGRRQAVLRQAADEIGGKVTAAVCDHTDPEQIHKLAATLPAEIHVIVNNAGGNPYFPEPETTGAREGEDDLAELSSFKKMWHEVLGYNLLTAVLTTRALSNRIPDGGALIHLGSPSAETLGTAYAAAKAGLSAWNIGVSRSLQSRDINSNVVAPGATDSTDYFRTEAARAARDKGWSQSSGRPSQPEEIADVIWFLASPGGHRISGQLVYVTAGAFPTR